MLFTYLLFNATITLIATHSQLIVVGFGKCTGPQLLWVILEMLRPKGSPFIYDDLMLGCEWKSVTSYQVLFQQGIPTYVSVAVS